MALTFVAATLGVTVAPAWPVDLVLPAGASTLAPAVQDHEPCGLG